LIGRRVQTTAYGGGPGIQKVMRDLGFYLLEIQGKIDEKWEFYGKNGN
jgi:hypothetical protein